MKTVLILGLTFLFMGSVFSQKIDDRLLERYTLEELNELKKNDNEKFIFLNYALNNATYIGDIPLEKNLQLEVIEMPSENATFISLGYEIENNNQFYRIQGTDKMLIVRSEIVLKHKLKNNK